MLIDMYAPDRRPTPIPKPIQTPRPVLTPTLTPNGESRNICYPEQNFKIQFNISIILTYQMGHYKNSVQKYIDLKNSWRAAAPPILGVAPPLGRTCIEP